MPSGHDKHNAAIRLQARRHIVFPPFPDALADQLGVSFGSGFHWVIDQRPIGATAGNGASHANSEILAARCGFPAPCRRIVRSNADPESLRMLCDQISDLAPESFG